MVNLPSLSELDNVCTSYYNCINKSVVFTTK